MKTSILPIKRPLETIAAALAIILASCNKIPSENAQGTLCWSFSRSSCTRARTDLPDTDSFILDVRNSAGDALYVGSYGKSPESMLVNPGSYSVKVVSREFSKPEFDAPQYGDEQLVIVTAGAKTRAVLNCSQINSGLCLDIDRGFSETYPGGYLTVSSSEGSLKYSESEKRIGFFKPGEVTVSLFDGTSVSALVTRSLTPKEILTLGIVCPSPSVSSAGLSIRMDTSRIWNNEDYFIGSGSGISPGAGISSAFSVVQAKEHAGETGVWVCGYIVGGDLSSTKNGIKFSGPFDSMTCIAIASRASVIEKESCMSVQLSKGDLREKLNLVEHPELLGCKIYLKGDIVQSYYGIPGIHKVSEFVIR